MTWTKWAREVTVYIRTYNDVWEFFFLCKMEKSRWERSERSERREHVVQQERVQRTEHYTQMLTQQGQLTNILT